MAWLNSEVMYDLWSVSWSEAENIRINKRTTAERSELQASGNILIMTIVYRDAERLDWSTLWK